MNIQLPEVDRVAIQRNHHYWPAGSLRPMTLEQMLDVDMPCKSAKRFVEIKNHGGNLYDRLNGREVLVREPVIDRPKKVKVLKRPGVVSRHGTLLRQAMTSHAEGLVHARASD